MSPIGRIFIVLNLILSAAFFGWAANALGHTRDLKEDLAKEQKAHADDVAAKDNEISKLTVDLSGVTDQQRTLREQRDGVQAEADRLKTQLDELKRASDTMQANLTKIQATLADYNSTIKQLEEQKTAAIEARHDAERARDQAVQDKDAAVMAQRDAQVAKRSADTRIGDLENERAGLQEQVSTLETRIAVIVKKTGINLNEIEFPPSIEAYVLDVNKDLKLVVLNKGKKDGVKEGYTFSIYRGSQFKGQVRIQDVQDGMSSALITGEKSPITRGDSATTSL